MSPIAQNEAYVPGAARRCLPLDRSGWRWIRGRRSPARRGSPMCGSPVRLPHCWTADDEYRYGVAMRRGWATYTLEFTFAEPVEDREWRLRCGGFYGIGRAWVNRHHAGDFNGDYLGLDLDLTKGLRIGENRLTIQVCNRYFRNVLPGIAHPDFHLYGGLGGNMRLEGLPRARWVRSSCHVEVDDVESGNVRLILGLVNHGGTSVSGVARIAIFDPDGLQVAQATSAELRLPPGGERNTAVPCRIARPRRWSLESPGCYRAYAWLCINDVPRDRVDLTFGLRTIRFEGTQGFLLNGRRVMLRGINRHENLPGFGFALAPCLQVEDARKIKALGLNFVRLSHYPQSPLFLDACDRLGLLVYAELCSWKRIGGSRWLQAAERQLARLIRRDRNHPCIILWGLGNEGRDRKAFQRLKALAKELDPARPTVYAENHAYRARRRGTAGLTDVWGLNYELDALETAKKASPSGCVVVSECANLPYARRGDWPAEAQQVALIKAALQRVENAGPGVSGWALWCYADYATPRRRRWFRECGLVDGWRANKMAADFLRARFSRDEPLLSVRGDWAYGSGRCRRIYIVTNCASIRLALDAGGQPEFPAGAENGSHGSGVPDALVPQASGSEHGGALNLEACEANLSTPHPGLYPVDLVFPGCPLRVVGRHGAGTVEVVLKPWGSASNIEMQAETMLLPPDLAGPASHLEGESRVVRCTLRVRDAQGASVRGYEGNARIELSPSARSSLIGGNRLPVHAGEAVYYVEPLPGGDAVRATCRLDNLPECSVRLFGPRSLPNYASQDANILMHDGPVQ